MDEHHHSSSHFPMPSTRRLSSWDRVKAFLPPLPLETTGQGRHRLICHSPRSTRPPRPGRDNTSRIKTPHPLTERITYGGSPSLKTTSWKGCSRLADAANDARPSASHVHAPKASSWKQRCEGYMHMNGQAYHSVHHTFIAVVFAKCPPVCLIRDNTLRYHRVMALPIWTHHPLVGGW